MSGKHCRGHGGKVPNIYLAYLALQNPTLTSSASFPTAPKLWSIYTLFLKLAISHPIGAITNYYKLSGFKQPQILIL